MGGLGNQLFQIFTLIAYTKRYNKDFKFQKKVIIGSRNTTYWDNLLTNLKPYVVLENNTLGLPNYNEQAFHYRSIPNIDMNFIMKGYFQSPRYFEDHYDEIIELIHLREQQNVIKNKLFLYGIFRSIGVLKIIVSAGFKLSNIQ